MPKPENKYDRKHLQFLEWILRQIDEIYKSATREAAAIGASIDNFDPDRPFEFKDYPLTGKRVERMMKQLGKALEVCVVNGVESEWTLANNKNNELANRVFGKNVGKLTQAQYRRYFSNNDAAREAFVKRKENGLTLSDRVWKYTDEFKDEIEMGIDLGLRGGLSADQMARDLQQYLQHPDMLFRRVRDEHGILHLSKRAKDYHPGRGVYRSSYKNARRLAATECNTAYRTADHERWQQMDFVVGQEVHLSGNHTCKGKDGKPHKFEDMCDKLAGKYPKDFKFTGWHPHCRCYATSILKTDEEIAEDTRRMLEGEDVDGESVNRVDDVPEGFKEWMSENEGRMEKAKTLPGFLRENSGYAEKEEPKTKSLYDIEEKIKAIIKAREKNIYVSFEPISVIIIEKLKDRKDLKLKLKLFGEIMKDERAEELFSYKDARTVVFPGHKGSQHKTWKGIKNMAKDLNRHGENVAFLSERDEGIDSSSANSRRADALVMFRGRPVVADFKYCTTKKANTLAGDLEEGFGQASTIVVKLENMDAGVFKEAIDYLVRNNIPYGNLKVINKYGDFVEITQKDIRFNNYKKKIKGFL